MANQQDDKTAFPPTEIQHRSTPNPQPQGTTSPPQVKPSRPALARHATPTPDAAIPPSSVSTTPRRGHSPRESRPLIDPPRRGDRLVDWLLMFLCLIVASPGLFVELWKPDVSDPREAHTVATSIQTYQRLTTSDQDDGFSPSRFQPFLNGQPQLRQPPGITWAHLGIFAFSPPDQIDRAVWLTRVSSVLMGLLTVAAVYWAGMSLGGRATAVFAALVCTASSVFLWEARSATADIHFTGWAMLGMAAALWAIRPLRPQPSVERLFIGWVVAGLALGMAISMDGPWAITKMVFPLLLMIMLCPNRMGHLLGLVAALLIGVLMGLPWVVSAHEHDPHAWSLIADELLPSRWLAKTDQELGHRALLMFSALLPWILWLGAAAIQPFSASSSGARTRLFLGWLWLIAASTVFLAVTPTHATAGDLLPVLPAAAIVIGQLFHQYSNLASEGRYPRSWRVLRWPHLAMLAVASIALPTLLSLEPNFLSRWPDLKALPLATVALPPMLSVLERGDLELLYTNQPGWWFWLGLSAALLGIVLLSIRWTIRHYPGKALVAWAAWTLLLLTTVAIPISRSDSMKNSIRVECNDFEDLIGDQPVYWLASGEPKDESVNASLLLYTRRQIPTTTVQQIARLQRKHEQFYLLRPETDLEKDDSGELRRVMPQVGRDLWLYTQLAASPGGDAPNE